MFNFVDVIWCDIEELDFYKDLLQWKKKIVWDELKRKYILAYKMLIWISNTGSIDDVYYSEIGQTS